MVTMIVYEWEVTFSLTTTARFPVEEGQEAKEEFRKWLFSKEGQISLIAEIKRLPLNSLRLPNYTEIGVDEISMIETEVKSTDTDPRV